MSSSIEVLISKENNINTDLPCYLFPIKGTYKERKSDHVYDTDDPSLIYTVILKINLQKLIK